VTEVVNKLIVKELVKSRPVANYKTRKKKAYNW